jgi:hypothetical protein
MLNDIMLTDNLCPPARWVCCMIVLDHSSESDVPVASYSHSLFMIESRGNVCSSCASPSCKQSMKLLATLIVATNVGAGWDTECWFLSQPCLARIRARLIWVLGAALPCSKSVTTPFRAKTFPPNVIGEQSDANGEMQYRKV